MERIVQIVTEKSVRKAVAKSGRYNREKESATWLDMYIYCDLLFDDGWRAAEWSSVELAVWNLHGFGEPNLNGKWNLTRESLWVQNVGLCRSLLGDGFLVG